MFNNLNQFTILIILGIFAIIVEIIIGAATGFELLILGVLFIIGGGVGMITGSMMVAVSVIVVLTLGHILFARQMIKQTLHITTTKTNTDSIIGRVAKVVTPIDPDESGQVKIEGEIWRAEAGKPIAKGKKVTIQSVSGVTVKVEEV